MAGSLNIRRVGLLVAIVATSTAGIMIYRSRTADSSIGSILGVVHKTEIRIAPEASGRLIEIKVKAGDQVHKGDVLAVLSSPELTASLAEAGASAASARADQANVDAGVRKEEVDSAAQIARIAEANLLFAQQQQTRAVILAARDFASK